MTSRADGFLGLLRGAAKIAAPAGAGGSLGLMLRVGHRNQSVVLLALFGIWVLSPFAGLVLADLVSKRWLVLMRAALYGVTVVVALGTLAIYASVAFGPPRAKPAFWFLVVPLVSWALIGIVAISGRLSARGGE